MINREPPEHRDDLLARAFPYRLTGVSEKTAVAVADWLTRDDPASVGGYGSSFALTRDVAVGDGRTLWLSDMSAGRLLRSRVLRGDDLKRLEQQTSARRKSWRPGI